MTTKTSEPECVDADPLQGALAPAAPAWGSRVCLDAQSISPIRTIWRM